MDAEDRELFERSLRLALDGAVGGTSGRAIDERLTELGWHDAFADDPMTAVSVLFELQGAANVTSSALDHVVLSAIGVSPAPATAVVLPPVGTWSAAGEIVDDGVDVRGLATAAFADAKTALIVVPSPDRDVVVSVATADLTTRAVHGLDPALGLIEVDGDGVRVTEDAQTASSPWTAAVDAARLALAHELLGASRRMLELAREHALERVQFGQPIGKFQAVRHRLAETLVAIEAADAVLVSAWDERDPSTTAMAKALAGRSARVAARHCQQVLAGIGFTTEHPFHLYLRRVLVVDELFGSSRVLTRTLGTELLATRQLPPPPPL